MSEFCMPSLGSDMEAGTLVEWLKAPGDRVERGDTIAVVETQKGAIEIEIFEDGVFDKLLVQIGETVPVGTPLALIGSAGEGASDAPAFKSELSERASPVPSASEPVQHPLEMAPAAAVSGSGVRASPAARKFALERHLDLSGIRGSGPDGAVVLDDVAALSGGQSKAPRRRPGLDAMAEAVAAAMSRSKRDIPHYYLSHRIDLTEALEWLEAANASRTPDLRILPGVIFVKAVALALTRHAGFNGHYTESRYQQSDAINIGVAVSIRGGGLVAPAIHTVDRLDLTTLMAHVRDVAGRVRSGRLRSSELSDATVTVTSLGERGVETMLSIIYPPQVAILGFGSIVERPWIVEGDVKVRRIVEVSLAGDHRVTDGHRGAALLREIDRLLQDPERL